MSFGARLVSRCWAMELCEKVPTNEQSLIAKWLRAGSAPEVPRNPYRSPLAHRHRFRMDKHYRSRADLVQIKSVSAYLLPYPSRICFGPTHLGSPPPQVHFGPGSWWYSFGPDPYSNCYKLATDVFIKCSFLYVIATIKQCCYSCKRYISCET